MERLERFKTGISDSLAEELLNGAKIIYSYLPNDKGFILIERETPVLSPDTRSFLFAMYEKLDDGKWYCAVEFIKMRKKSVIKNAFIKYREGL